VLNFIRRFNQVSSWVVSEIVKTDKPKQRITVMKHFLKVAQACFKLNNFQSVMHILSVLESSPISRLKKTWWELGSKPTTIMTTLKEHFKFEKNYKNYRALLSSVTGTAIPFFGITLSDLTFVDEGNTEWIEENNMKLLNVQRLSLVAQVVLDILKYQNVPYTGIEVDENLRAFLIGAVQSAIGEKEAYARSLEIEPRK